MLDLGGLCPPLPHCTHPLWGLQSLEEPHSKGLVRGWGGGRSSNIHITHMCGAGRGWLSGVCPHPQSKSECTLVHSGAGVCRPWNRACVSTFVCVHVNAYERMHIFACAHTNAHAFVALPTAVRPCTDVSAHLFRGTCISLSFSMFWIRFFLVMGVSEVAD